ncbi:MAG TPA: hypothetical protein VFV38_12375 [Ktedonobacteraceae bacterium]|nr:hypothetical protein [Ktedonobacteraceae bacterium]
MKHFTRRNFVKVGAGLAAFVPAIKELASTNVSYAASIFSENQTPSNYFVAGHILSVRGDNLLIEDEEHLVTQVSVTSSTHLWRGGWISSANEVKAGDFIYTRGALQGSTLRAVYAWVNIVNIPGIVTVSGADSVQLKGKNGTYEVRLNAQTERYFGSALQTGRVIAAASPLHVIGLWDERTQSITATSVFTPNPEEPRVAVEPQDQAKTYNVVPQALSRYYYGLGSWFCCGSAWGPCGSAGHGACGTCNSSHYNCAWPDIGTNCYFVGCGEPSERVSCGQKISIYNHCTGKTVSTTVADCGPNEKDFCGQKAPDCGSYYDRIVDMTPAAFSAIAPLNQGICSVRCH